MLVDAADGGLENLSAGESNCRGSAGLKLPLLAIALLLSG